MTQVEMSKTELDCRRILRTLANDSRGVYIGGELKEIKELQKLDSNLEFNDVSEDGFVKYKIYNNAPEMIRTILRNKSWVHCESNSGHNYDSWISVKVHIILDSQQYEFEAFVYLNHDEYGRKIKMYKI